MQTSTDHNDKDGHISINPANNLILIKEESNILQDIFHAIFEFCRDGDETMYSTAQKTLTKIIQNYPSEATDILLSYKTNHLKVQKTIILVLKAVRDVVTSNSFLPIDAYKNLITLSLEELISSPDHFPLIQNNALDILVAIGSKENCNLVVEALMVHINAALTQPKHFMIMQCFGDMALNNIPGMTPFVQPILSIILPSLENIKQDHIKQAYAYAIGRLCEVLLEQPSVNLKTSSNTDVAARAIEFDVLINISVEISIPYEMFFNNWLNSRDTKVCTEVLRALSSMFALLPLEKIQDQSSRMITQILNLYRRSIDRNVVTQFISSVLKTNIDLQCAVLDEVADLLISQLFDLVCVHPDYRKPQTVKGHYEILRCFHLLCTIYPHKIIEILLMNLRNNSERERMKSLLILTHLLNTSSTHIEKEVQSFIACLKQMIICEKTVKMKMTLLKTIVAFAQKAFINEKEFVWFIIHYCRKYSKVNQEHGNSEEHSEFVISCQNSLFMLSSTLGVIDMLLKRELLNYFVLLDYTDVCSLIAKCLASLFAKSADIEYEVCENDKITEEAGTKIPSLLKCDKIIVPSVEMIFARCLALLGNNQCIKRSINILSFLRYYYPHLNPDLGTLWEKSIPNLILNISGSNFYLDKLIDFINDTYAFFSAHDKQFLLRLVNSMADQMFIYPIALPYNEFIIPDLQNERAMLLKAFALTLCYIEEEEVVSNNIDLILKVSKQEKLDKHTKHVEYEERIIPYTIALGHISRVHLNQLVTKLTNISQGTIHKQATSFFSNLHFIKDTQKELDSYKSTLLVIKTLDRIMCEAYQMPNVINLDEDILDFLLYQLKNCKDQTIISATLKTLLSFCNEILNKTSDYNKLITVGHRKQFIKAIFNITFEAPYDDLPLFSVILKLGTNFIRMGNTGGENSIDDSVLFEIACKNFFKCAQHLKAKFETPNEEEHNSYLAKHLNESLSELCDFVKVIIQLDPSPAALDIIVSIIDNWIRDQNCEVRVCASQLFSNTLDAYMNTMKIDCEASSKFNQTGQILGKVVPRCMDLNGTVRQISVNILRKILEISYVYETLTIPDNKSHWIEEIDLIKDTIICNDSANIHNCASDIGKVISKRISNFQYIQFCKTLLQGLKHPEHCSAIGTSIVLNIFIKYKGAELFHTIPDLVKNSLETLNTCQIIEARLGVLKAMVSLTKHHPKLVVCELLEEELPFDANIVEFWHLISTDGDLTNILLEHFLQSLSCMNLYDINETAGEKRKNINIQSLAIFCVLHEILECNSIKDQLNKKFPDLFAVLLTSLAAYTNIKGPVNRIAVSSSCKLNKNIKTKFNNSGLRPAEKEVIRLNPFQIVLETFRFFLSNLAMEQIADVLKVKKNSNEITDLNSFIELLMPIAIGLAKQIDITSSIMKEIVTVLSKYVSSPYDCQRIAVVGLLSCLVALKPQGVISNIIMQQLTSALSDPNATVRGLSIQGMGYVGELLQDDINKYTETAISALFNGIDDTTSDSLINTPLESMRGLSRLLRAISNHTIEPFHVSLAIRIRPLLSSYSFEMRQTAITLFSDLCESKLPLIDDNTSSNTVNESLREQLFGNLFSLLLHMSENESSIRQACKSALINVCKLLNLTEAINIMQSILIDNDFVYETYIVQLIKVIVVDFRDHVQDFIDSCIPKLRSQLPEVRGAACISIGILNSFLYERNAQTDAVSYKLTSLLKDDNFHVRLRAVNALGFFFDNVY